jgi:hypothetical protein
MSNAPDSTSTTTRSRLTTSPRPRRLVSNAMQSIHLSRGPDILRRCHFGPSQLHEVGLPEIFDPGTCFENAEDGQVMRPLGTVD